MYCVLIRKRIWIEIGRQTKYQVLCRQYSSRVPAQAIQKHESTHDDGLSNIQAIAVPVKLPPTIDVSKRNETVAIPDEKVVRSKENRPGELPWTVTPSTDRSKLMKHYLMLSKSRLTSLVVITSMAGYAMAPAPFELSTFVLCSIGTGLMSGAANAINQYHEVPFDAQMSRTKNRVLVKGMLTPAHAVGFATVAATTGLSILYFGVNAPTAALGAANLILYTSIYTPMKRYSILNTWVGSIVGSIPPLMGWMGCAGHLDAGAWILAGLLYAWQFPHFNALSWNLRPDYSRAGYRMMSVTNPGLCRRTALRYTAVIGGLSLAAPYFDVTNLWFALETLPLNIYFGYLAWQFYKKSDSGSSRKLFRFSLIHLPALMILFLLNKKRWIFTEQKDIPLENVIATSSAASGAVVTIAKGNSKIENQEIPKNVSTTSLKSTPNTSLGSVLPVAAAASSKS